MERKPIYSDMDNVLIAPIIDPVTDEPIDLIIRPGVKEFLEKLSVYGELNLLTAASLGWARIVLRRMGPIASLFKQVITAEDLYPIDQQLQVIRRADWLSSEDREQLYRQIQPILPPGVVFDDFPVGSDMYRLKGLATGIANLNPHLWIQVEEFTPDQPDRGGLRKAYEDFKKRNAAWRARPSIGRKDKGTTRVFERSPR